MRVTITNNTGQKNKNKNTQTSKQNQKMEAIVVKYAKNPGHLSVKIVHATLALQDKLQLYLAIVMTLCTRTFSISLSYWERLMSRRLQVIN